MIALSWSRLSTFMQCPRKFHLSYISKSFKEEEKSIHLVKGEQLHKQMEDYIIATNGQATMPLGFSPEVRQTLPYVDSLYKMFDAIHPEAQVACDINWQPQEWFGKDVAWRSIWDATALRPDTCFIVDWKSGKVYPYGDGFGQLHLSAIMALEKWPGLVDVRAAYVYLEHKVVTPIRVAREPGVVGKDGKPVAHLKEVKQFFENWFDKVQMEKAYEPIVNENCKWCPATKAQCKYSRKL
jgi:hypothetical protein